jgi:micrococcal nuclease
VRYLLVDTPEITGGKMDCYGTEARDFNRTLVEGQTIGLRYDEECTDRYDRLLAYIDIGDREVNEVLVERGLACVLHIAPNGDDRVDEFEVLQARAEARGVGMWGACETVACD